MKKIKIYLTILLILTLSSCNKNTTKSVLENPPTKEQNEGLSLYKKGINALRKNQNSEAANLFAQSYLPNIQQEYAKKACLLEIYSLIKETKYSEAIDAGRLAQQIYPYA